MDVRLELSRRTDLALRTLRHLDDVAATVARNDLAAAIGTTPDFLARVVAPLVQTGWVRSGPGRGGGYELQADLDAVSVLDLIEITEGVPEAGACVLRSGPCDPNGRCELHDAWTTARDSLLTELRRTPLGARRRR